MNENREPDRIKAKVVDGKPRFFRDVNSAIGDEMFYFDLFDVLRYEIYLDAYPEGAVLDIRVFGRQKGGLYLYDISPKSEFEMQF